MLSTALIPPDLEAEYVAALGVATVWAAVDASSLFSPNERSNCEATGPGGMRTDDDVSATLTAEQRASLTPLADVLVGRDLEPAPGGGAAADFRCRWCDPAACGHPGRCPVTAAVRG